MDSITPHCAAVSINKAVFTADSGPLRVARSPSECDSMRIIALRVDSSGRIFRLERKHPDPSWSPEAESLLHLLRDPR